MLKHILFSTVHFLKSWGWKCFIVQFYNVDTWGKKLSLFIVQTVIIFIVLEKLKINWKEYWENYRLLLFLWNGVVRLPLCKAKTLLSLGQDGVRNEEIISSRLFFGILLILFFGTVNISKWESEADFTEVSTCWFGEQNCLGLKQRLKKEIGLWFNITQCFTLSEWGNLAIFK